MNTVLVVDDEPGIIRLCQRLLERARFHVMAVTDPREGIAILQQERVDLLLVDIRMPGVDGFQVIDLAHHHQPDVAVVIMTGYGTVETAVEALRRGADGLVLKPFAGAELVQSVERALQESRYKQDVIRLQTLRPLFTIAEKLFTEAVFGTDPNRLQGLLLDAVLSHLNCSVAGLYGRLGGRGDGAQTSRPGARDGAALSGAQGGLGKSQASPPLTKSHKRSSTPLRLLAGRGELPMEEEDNPEHSAVARAEAWGIPIRINREGPGDAGLQAALAKRGLGSVMAAPMTPPLSAAPPLVNSPAPLSSLSSTPAPLASALPPADNAEDGGSNESHREASGSKSLGGKVLLAARKSGEPPFRESDLEIFAILSRQAAIALENASLQAELRATLQQVEESQRALIKAEKMAIAGRLTASIAHEVNNPLQAVQNCLHLAGRKELPSEDRQSYLNMAQTELERLMHTVQRMLDYYRPAALDRRPVDINALVQRVLSLLERQLQDHQIRLDTYFEPAMPQAWAVADQIQQVLLNLVLNAMEAMPSGGTLTLRTSTWKEGIEVIVEDTGPGIKKDQRERLFEPLFSSKEGGTGLGLAISYGIMAAHGGSLDLISGSSAGVEDNGDSGGRGKGACFRMSLPAGITPER